MKTPDFFHRQKPAFISFLLLYLLCFGISYLLIDNSREVSRRVVDVLTKLRMLRPYLHTYGIHTLPYGIIFAFPFLVYGAGKLLWNIMTTYEITPSHVRLMAGSLRRKEQLFPLAGVHEVSFTQTLIEVPFGAGSLILHRGGSDKVEIKGVYRVKRVVDEIREKISNPYR
jgi:uncharacterized membrane protein YdbT with pleckstrin-like domain